MTGCVRARLALVLGAVAMINPAALAGKGTFTVPQVTGRPATQPFAGHPGWVDVFKRGYGVGTSARIAEDGTFELPDPDKPVCLVAMFDKIETPPVILPRWPISPGNYDVPIPAEYACLPPGFPGDFDMKQKVERPGPVPDVRAALHAALRRPLLRRGQGGRLGQRGARDAPQGCAHRPAHPDEGPGLARPRLGRQDRSRLDQPELAIVFFAWAGGTATCRSSRGKTYVLEVEGYRSHSGKHYETGAFIRPDKGDGYPDGQASVGEKKLDGDLCLPDLRQRPRPARREPHPQRGMGVLHPPASSQHRLGPDVHLARRQPGRRHLLGLRRGRQRDPVRGPRARGGPVGPDAQAGQGGPRSRVAGPADHPLSRYARRRCRATRRGTSCPASLFQVAYMPDEMPLKPGKTYYVELVPTRPVMMYADGDFYQQGFAYYEGLKMERAVAGRTTMHSKRWTLAMNIVTYENKDGMPQSR